MGARYFLTLLLVGMTQAAERGGWAIENPALAAPITQTWEQKHMADLLPGHIPQLRREYTAAAWLRLLYDWMPETMFAAQQAYLTQELSRGWLFLPQKEWSKPCQAKATDPKIFLNSVLYAKQSIMSVLTEKEIGQLKRFRILNLTQPSRLPGANCPAEQALMKGTAEIGGISFTYNPLQATPPNRGVVIWIEFELFGGVFLVENDKVLIPLTYTPYLRIIYGLPEDANTASM